MTERSDKVEIRVLSDSGSVLLNEVVALGDKHKKTLGLIPRAAFADYAARGRILIATIDDALVGYALFDLPGQRVRLGQLCVATEVRDRGVARRLVDELSNSHLDRTGISLRCRRDWPASKAWPKLGFEPRSNAPGRSAEGHLLTAWWRDHGHPDLFNTVEDDRSRTVVVIDSNVFRDLHEPGRAGSDESKSLVADWLSESIELVITPGLINEVNNDSRPAVRDQLLKAVALYRVLRGDLDSIRTVERQIVGSFSPRDIERDVSLLNDARLVAEAVAMDASAFVSRDQNAVEKISPLSSRLSDIWVSTPTDLIVHLDELRDGENYAPARLLDTGFTIAEAPGVSEGDLYALINHAVGETKSRFRQVARSAASEVGNQSARRILRDPAGKVCGGMFWSWTGSSLVVELFRVCHPRLERTIANHMTHLLRKEARERRLESVEIVDNALSETSRSVLKENGFVIDSAGTLQCLVVDGCLSWAEARTRVRPRANESEDVHRVEPPSGLLASEIERVYWPLKVVDADLPCFLIPIRPGPAEHLFGKAPSLFGRDADLGLSRQHVYYKAPRPLVLTVPGRILWYMSGANPGVIASSRLDDVQVSHPKTLHRKYRRLGVLELSVIEKSAKGGRAAAVLFSDTELFEDMVSLSRLRAVDGKGGLEPLPSPRRISVENFFKVYQEGNPR